MCRWGFSKVQKILKDAPDDRVRVYVIWDPIFGGNFDVEVKKLSSGFPDKRVSYYKDPDSLAGNLWERVLKTQREIAWDVYLLYGADAQWDEQPPQPEFWMHQLDGVTLAPRLDEEKFTQELKELLDKPGSKDSKRKLPTAMPPKKTASTT
jgi:hypothetical protein